jgi:hypothetical protein
LRLKKQSLAALPAGRQGQMSIFITKSGEKRDIIKLKDIT